MKEMHLVGQILAIEVNGRKLFDFPFAVSVESGFNQEETELCTSGLKHKTKRIRISLCCCTPLKTMRILRREQLTENAPQCLADGWAEEKRWICLFIEVNCASFK